MEGKGLTSKKTELIRTRLKKNGGVERPIMTEPEKKTVKSLGEGPGKRTVPRARQKSQQRDEFEA